MLGNNIQKLKSCRSFLTSMQTFLHQNVQHRKQVYQTPAKVLVCKFVYTLKRISKPKHARLKFDLEKLKDPNVLETFLSYVRWEVCTSHHHEH